MSPYCHFIIMDWPNCSDATNTAALIISNSVAASWSGKYYVSFVIVGWPVKDIYRQPNLVSFGIVVAAKNGVEGGIVKACFNGTQLSLVGG
jgi:hypothetical protein